MKHFRILKAEDEDTLAEYVEKAINDGWSLAGDWKIQRNYFYQPIMKITSDREWSEELPIG